MDEEKSPYGGVMRITNIRQFRNRYLIISVVFFCLMSIDEDYVWWCCVQKLNYGNIAITKNETCLELPSLRSYCNKNDNSIYFKSNVESVLKSMENK